MLAAPEVPTGRDANPAPSVSGVLPEDATIERFTKLISFIFSWVILLPVAVIVSGKLLATTFVLHVRTPQQLNINLFILKIKSTDEEVILGFAGFIITLFVSLVFGGSAIYGLVKSQFGIDPGQFNAVCVFSSFAAVTWSALLFVVSRYRKPSKEQLDTTAERDKLVEAFARAAEPEKEPPSAQ